MRARKETLADTMRRWHMPESKIKQGLGGLRYRQPVEKGIYWYWFSLFIRTRDLERYGACISCGRTLETLQDGDCGHFAPARFCGRDLIFDRLNNNMECARCNAWDEFHLVGYAKGLDARYGEGTADSLKLRYEEYQKNKVLIKDWSRAEYIEKLELLFAEAPHLLKLKL